MCSVGQYCKKCVLIGQNYGKCVLIGWNSEKCVLIGQYCEKCVLIGQNCEKCVLIGYGTGTDEERGLVAWRKQHEPTGSIDEDKLGQSCLQRHAETPKFCSKDLQLDSSFSYVWSYDKIVCKYT